jgi:hypothetical protein
LLTTLIGVMLGSMSLFIFKNISMSSRFSFGMYYA